eukprot:TRINITY_DN1823_c0_g1_i1.p1 TRINITY_DN1823_c0_g1~~TRINITY_DN1823_c0_g1_i1.p1  ORF type:complete len:152 (-),score=35.40 TRINITY_DN1823_c0_g1_i1:165-587(-)
MSQQQQPSQAQQAAMQTFNRMRQELAKLQGKIQELEGSAEEHQLVIKAMEKLEPERKAFRNIGGVLVERTVGEVLPSVKETRDNIVKTVVQLKSTHEERNVQMREFALENNLIRESAQKTTPEGGEAVVSEKKGQAGVLV